MHEFARYKPLCIPFLLLLDFVLMCACNFYLYLLLDPFHVLEQGKCFPFCKFSNKYQ